MCDYVAAQSYWFIEEDKFSNSTVKAYYKHLETLSCPALQNHILCNLLLWEALSLLTDLVCVVHLNAILGVE